jgi:hypothetical protein
MKVDYNIFVMGCKGSLKTEVGCIFQPILNV